MAWVPPCAHTRTRVERNPRTTREPRQSLPLSATEGRVADAASTGQEGWPPCRRNSSFLNSLPARRHEFGSAHVFGGTSVVTGFVFRPPCRRRRWARGLLSYQTESNGLGPSGREGCPREVKVYLEQEREKPSSFLLFGAMAFLRSLAALLLLALNTAAAQGSTSSQPSFFLQDPSDGECCLCATWKIVSPPLPSVFCVCAVCVLAAYCGHFFFFSGACVVFSFVSSKEESEREHVFRVCVHVEEGNGGRERTRKERDRHRHRGSLALQPRKYSHRSFPFLA